MKKEYKKIFFACFILIYGLIGFTACEREKNKSTSVDAEKENESMAEEDSLVCQGKIWLTHSLSNAQPSAPAVCAFYITDIEDNKIEGKLKTIRMTKKEYAYQGITEEMTEFPFEGSFSGIKNGDKATCEFEDDSTGYSGSMVVQFYDTGDKLAVTVNDGVQCFYSPWNLQTAESLDQDSIKSVPANLEDYGQVQIVSATLREAGKTYPSVYIVDEEDNVLYRFEMGYETGAEVTGISIEDLNGDGYADVRIGLGREGSEGEKTNAERIFYRQEGFFKESDDFSKKQEADCQQYKEKIWYWEMDSQIGDTTFKELEFSFYLSEVRDGKIYGRCRLGDMVRKDEQDENQEDGYFYGSWIDGIAVCRFWGQWGNEGWLTIEELGEDYVIAKVELTIEDSGHMATVEEISDQGETGTFWLLNLERNNERRERSWKMEVVDSVSYPLHLQYWGDVDLVLITAKHMENNYDKAYAYLTTSEEAILYEFELTTTEPSVKASEFEVQDYNHDDLEDIGIRIVSFDGAAASDDMQNGKMIYFYQQEDGRFIDVDEKYEDIVPKMKDGLQDLAMSKYYKTEMEAAKETAKSIFIRYYEVDLNDDYRKDRIVYLATVYPSGEYADSFQILLNTGDSYKKIEELPVSLFTYHEDEDDYINAEMIYIMDDKSNGFHDIEITNKTTGNRALLVYSDEGYHIEAFK